MTSQRDKARNAANARSPLTAALLTGAMLAGGCVAPTPIFPPVDAALVWPPPPDKPRIRYIGALTGEASLHIKPKGWAALEELLAGPRQRVEFVQPTAVAVNGQRVAVADPGAAGGAALHVLDLDARTFVSLRAGFAHPIDVAVLGERWVVADAAAAAVFVADDRGRSTTRVAPGRFRRPVALAVRGAGGLWVLDGAAHACTLLDISTDGSVRTIGGRGAAPGEFNFPSGLALGRVRGVERLVVADAMNFRVSVVDEEGGAALCFGRKGDAAGDFSFPRDVAIDSDGNIYVLDKHFENVQLFDGAGRLLMAFGGGGAAAGRFSLPSGITIDAADRVWIADTGNRRVQVFQYLKEPQS